MEPRPAPSTSEPAVIVEPESEIVSVDESEPVREVYREGEDPYVTYGTTEPKPVPEPVHVHTHDEPAHTHEPAPM